MTHHLYDDVASSSESRHVYLHLFHYRYFVCVCSACCCGGQDAEAPFQHNISIGLSQARTPKALSFSQKNHICEKCSLVLRSMFHLAEHEETQHSQKVFRYKIHMKQCHFGANLQKHQKQYMDKKSFRNDVDRALFVKCCKLHMSEKPSSCEKVKRLSGHLRTSPATVHSHQERSQTILSSMSQLYKAEKVITTWENARKP